MRAILTVAALGTAALPARAQEQARPFPYSMGSHDAILGLAGVGTTVLGLSLVGNLDPVTAADLAALDPATVNAFDRGTAGNYSRAWQERSDVSRNVLAATSAMLAIAPTAMDGRWKEVATLGAMFAETAFLVVGTSYVTKGLTTRMRPYAYNSDLTVEQRLDLAGPDGKEVFLSYFSGHASAAFGTAVLVSTIFQDLHGNKASSLLVWGVSMSAASFAAYARVAAGKHFPTDVLTGAAVGSAIGFLVPALHRGNAPDRIRLSAGPDGFGFSIPVGGG